MGCNKNYATAGASYNNACDNTYGGCGSGFSCIINLIIILIVLQFLTQIICGLQCDQC